MQFHDTYITEGGVGKRGCARRDFTYSRNRETM